MPSPQADVRKDNNEHQYKREVLDDEMIVLGTQEDDNTGDQQAARTHTNDVEAHKA